MKLNLILVIALMSSGYALNPIHEASYKIRPKRTVSPGIQIQTGFYLSPESSQKLRIPAGIAWGQNDNLELGAAVKTRWLDEPNNVRHMVFGGRYRLEDVFSLQADILLGTANYAGDALTITMDKDMDWSSRISTPLMARLGFLDGLVWGPDGFMAFEIGAYPTLEITEMIFLELGITSASQVGNFTDYFCIDLQPDLIIELNHDFQMVIGAILGTAGPRKSKLRLQTILTYSL